MKQNVELLKKDFLVIMGDEYHGGEFGTVEGGYLYRFADCLSGAEEEAYAGRVKDGIFDFVKLDLDVLPDYDIDWQNDYVEVRMKDGSRDLYPLSDIEALKGDFTYDRIYDLTPEELGQLYDGVSLGSVYLGDYKNRFFISRVALRDLCDEFLTSMYEEYGEDEQEAHISREEFVSYFICC